MVLRVRLNERRRTVRYRRSPYLVAYWRGRDLILHNFATGSRLRATPIVCDLLDGLNEWQSVDRLTATCSRDEARAVGALVDELTRRSILDRSDRAVSHRARAMLGWAPWNPAAGFFHFSTKDTAYATVAESERTLRRRARTRPMPPPVKRYRGVPQVRLAAPATGTDLARSLIERRTWRHFSTRPLDLPALGTLLGLTWGVQRWANVFGQGAVPLKTSPSGGARHPIEAYVLARRVRGLTPGLYHYAAGRHALERIKRGATGRDIVRYLAGQRWYAPASALVIMTAVFPREQWRYRSPRAYRTVLIDAGHLCQTFCLLATSLGLAPFCTMALAETAIERDMGIDGVSEAPMYVAGVGTRPFGGWNARRQRAALRR